MNATAKKRKRARRKLAGGTSPIKGRCLKCGISTCQQLGGVPDAEREWLCARHFARWKRRYGAAAGSAMLGGFRAHAALCGIRQRPGRRQ